MDLRDLLFLVLGFAAGYFAKTILAKVEAAYTKAHATEQAFVAHLKADAASVAAKL